MNEVRLEIEAGKQIGTILDITSNGDDLLDPENAINGQDFVDLIMDIYEDECNSSYNI